MLASTSVLRSISSTSDFTLDSSSSLDSDSARSFSCVEESVSFCVRSQASRASTFALTLLPSSAQPRSSAAAAPRRVPCWLRGSGLRCEFFHTFRARTSIVRRWPLSAVEAPTRSRASRSASTRSRSSAPTSDSSVSLAVPPSWTTVNASPARPAPTACLLLRQRLNRRGQRHLRLGQERLHVGQRSSRRPTRPPDRRSWRSWRRGCTTASHWPSATRHSRPRHSRVLRHLRPRGRSSGARPRCLEAGLRVGHHPRPVRVISVARLSEVTSRLPASSPSPSARLFLLSSPSKAAASTAAAAEPT